jgi:hypothetical protein
MNQYIDIIVYCTWPQWLCFYVFLFYRVKCTWILTYPIHVSFTKMFHFHVDPITAHPYAPNNVLPDPSEGWANTMGIWHFQSKTLKMSNDCVYLPLPRLGQNIVTRSTRDNTTTRKHSRPLDWDNSAINSAWSVDSWIFFYTFMKNILSAYLYDIARLLLDLIFIC